MSNNHPNASRSSLHRKPPPGFLDSSGSFGTDIPIAHPDNMSVPIHQDTLNSVPTVPPRPKHSEFTNSTSSLLFNVFPKYHDPNATYDEDYLSYENARPKGPQQLPYDEYADTSFEVAAYADSPYTGSPETSYLDTPDAGLAPASPNNLFDSGRQKYRVRKYQNLLQRGTSPLGMENLVHTIETYGRDASELPEPLAPYPVHELYDLDMSDIDPIFGNRDGNTADTNVEKEGRDYDDTYFDQEDRTYSRLDPAKGAFGQYDEGYSHAADSTVDYSNITDYSGIYDTPSRIPTLLGDLSPRNRYPQSGSPEYSFLQSSRYSSSPELSPLSGRQPHTYSNYVSDSRSSRSPSPRKSSPSRTGFYPTEDFVENMYDYRTPRWSLLDNDIDAYSELATPITNTFDYDNLPELPQPEESPNRNMTLKSTMSFFRKEDAFPMSASMRRRNDALPPVPLDLPQLPFSSSSLTGLHFAKCTNVWSMRDIFAWCMKLNDWLHGQQIPQKEFRKALIKLVVYHKRHIPIDLIGKNVTQIIASFTAAGGISVSTDKQEKFVTVQSCEISGVLVDLTDCYTEHMPLAFGDKPWKCYLSQCLMNKMIEHENLMKNITPQDLVLQADWASHWQLTAEDVNMDPAISKRQSLIFDLIKFEQNFIQRAQCFVDVAAPQFIKAASLLGDVSAGKLRENICVPAQELAEIHRTFLYEPLVRILITDGRLISNIVGIASLYEEWSKKARSPLLSYMGAVPMIEDLLRRDVLKEWDQPLRQNARMRELQVNGNLLLMSTFNLRYQQLPLQLSDIRKSFDEQDDEYILLTKAIDAIKKLGVKVNEMKVHADNIHALRVLEQQLVWKSNIHQPRINLSLEKRKFFYRGDLSRRGDLKINSHNVHLIVLDNYLLITEQSRRERGVRFKVVETPIPTDFLIIENRDKEGVVSKGTNPNMPKLPDPEELTTYPFKVRYAGRGKYQSYTFLAASEQDRNKWLAVFEKTRSNLLKRVLPLAPYTLELVDNSFFAYEYANRVTKLPILPLIDPVLQLSGGTTTSLKARGITTDVYLPNIPRNLVVYKKVQCAEIFDLAGTRFHFLGLTSGVYCSDMKNRWKMIINMSNVTKMSVLPALNVVLVLANKQLRYYPLQLLIDIYYEHKDRTTSVQLSNDSILFYEVGRHRGVPMLFVAKKKNAGTTTFKVFSIETDNNGILSTFSVVKRFYIQAECYGISLFNTSVSVHTQRGFEILDLQKLAPRTVPELPVDQTKKIDAYKKKELQGVEAIRRAISHSTVRPMGMFKLKNNKEFLLVYNECAIVVNKSGKLSRTTVIRFDFRPKSIAFTENNLFLVCDEVIEVWSISDFANGTNKLVQVIPSKDVGMLSAPHLYFSTANPRVPGLQMEFCLQVKN